MSAIGGAPEQGLPVQELQLPQPDAQPIPGLTQAQLVEMLTQLQQHTLQQQLQQQQEEQAQHSQQQGQYGQQEQHQQIHLQHNQQQQQEQQQDAQADAPQPMLAREAEATPPAYPQATATHEEVLADEQLFHTTLAQLQEALHIKDKVPKIGKQQLNLHLLYTTVTSLGGCERVISRKQWRDVAGTFTFPSTITSASYALRRAYIVQLWDYEQVYYQRMGGQPRIAAPLPSKRASDAGTEGQIDMDAADTHATPLVNGGGSGVLHAGLASGGTGKRSSKRPRVGTDAVINGFPALSQDGFLALTAHATTPGEAHAALVGSRGHVIVDARFDAGFFVTVQLGRDTFRGMLYYPPPEHTVGAGEAPVVGPPPPAPPRASTAGTPAVTIAAPKPNRTPFNFYTHDARARAKLLYPDASALELTKHVGEMWAQLSDYDKAPYLAIANQDKARYASELEAQSYRMAAAAAQAQAAQEATAVQAAMQALKEVHTHAQAAALAASAAAVQEQLPIEQLPIQQLPIQELEPIHQDPNTLHLQQLQLQLQLLQQQTQGHQQHLQQLQSPGQQQQHQVVENGQSHGMDTAQ